MKWWRLLPLMLLLTGTLSAQDVVRETMQEDDYTETIVIQRPKRVDKHEFRFGVGTYSLAADLFLDGPGWYDAHEPDFRQDMMEADTYLTKRRFYGTYSLSYAYHSRRWLQIGATLSFSATTRSRRDNLTNDKIENLNQYAVGVMSTFRFVYLYREKVQLYSGLSLGVVGGTGATFFWLDPTLIGCSFGKDLFGYVELGGGFSGVARIGMGYRFDSAKKGKK